MLFNVSHVRNGICQTLLVNARSAEIAEKYFKEQKPNNEFLGIHEATNDDKRPGKPVMWVPEGYGLEKLHKEMGKRMGFRDFKDSVRRQGGIWASEDVYFSQFRDGYSAAYQPEYPERSERDCTIGFNWLKNAWSLNGGESFIEACIAGEASVDDLDAYVEFWHEHETGNKLHEFLGISREECGHWIKTDDDSFIRAILEERKSGKTVDELIATARDSLPQERGTRKEELDKIGTEK